MIPEDRLEIDDNDILWRRLTAPEWIKEQDGARRVSSAAFKGSPHDIELSTHAAKLTTLDWVFNSRPYALGVGEIVAREPRELGLRIEHDPEGDDYSHTVVHLNPTKGIREKHAKKLARKASLKERPVLVENELLTRPSNE
ncbi:MAG TPA: hypothetical protein VGQ39_23775 [Pyrinomonadaceae bacterium]|jgi:hypothetical protein|nr:hypothetical protein [Pyrinomonadaceae bacterium]